MADQSDEKIDLYLKEVRSGLHGIGEDEVRDILQELRSHILDRAKGTDALPDIGTAAAIESLGTPEEIASEYITEHLIACARASRVPWAVLRAVVRWASLSLSGFVALIICAFGYFLGGVFLLSALLKPFDPASVGLWARSHPSFSLSLLVGAPDQGAGARELLGWWIIPVGIVVGVGLFVLTTKLGLWATLRFQRSRKIYFTQRRRF